MRKTSMIVGSLFLLAVCTGCGKSDYAVTPENVALYAQGSSENSFFQLFDAAKDQAKVEEAARKQLLDEQRAKLEAMPSKGGVTPETKAAIREALGIV